MVSSSMNPLNTRVGLLLLACILWLGSIGVTMYNNLVLKQAVDEAKYEWVEMGGLVDVEGKYIIWRY